MANSNLLEYGEILIDGQLRKVRWSIYSITQAMTALGSASFQITGNGQGDFIVVGLSRGAISGAGADVTATTRFTCSLQISDGSTPLTYAGNVASSDRVLDTLLFGASAAFPAENLGPIYLGSTSQLRFQATDLSNTAYTLHVAAYVGIIV